MRQKDPCEEDVRVDKWKKKIALQEVLTCLPFWHASHNLFFLECKVVCLRDPCGPTCLSGSCGRELFSYAITKIYPRY